MISPYVSQQPVDDFGLAFSSLRYGATLLPAANASLVIPGNAPRYKALIKTGFGTGNAAGVWVAHQPEGTAAIVAAAPVGPAVLSNTGEFVNFATVLCREVKAGDTLHFFTIEPGVDVSIVLYALSTPN